MSYSKSFLANQWSRRFIKKGTKDNKYKQDTFYEWNSHAHCKLYQKKKNNYLRAFFKYQWDYTWCSDMNIMICTFLF